jgi:methyl-accepting chemotaxis protein
MRSLQTPLKPAIALADRLTIAGKLLLIACVLVTPLAMVMTAYIRGEDAQASFAASELVGVRYLSQAIPLLIDLNADRAAVQVGDAPPRKLDGDVKALTAAESAAGGKLKLATVWAQTQPQLAPLLSSSASVGVDDYDQAISAVGQLVASAGNSSKLILDPQLDTYYLVDAWMLRVPAIVGGVFSASAAVGDLPPAAMSPRVLEGLAAAETVVTSNLAALTQDRTTVLANTGRRSEIEAEFDPDGLLQSGAQIQANEMHAIVDGAGGRMDPTTVATAAAGVETQLGTALDQLIGQRIARLHGAEYRALGEACIALAIAGWLFFGVLVGVRRSVAVVLHRLTRLADGDFTSTGSVRSRDEIGKMNSAATVASGSLGGAMRTVAATTRALQNTTARLVGLAQTIAAAAGRTTTQADVVSEAATRVEHSSLTIAGGVEQIGSSIAEIASNAAQASGVAQSAVALVEAANSSLNKLGASSEQIGHVVKVISSIAKQTNLLALNATIESARAGAAGSGFAVVAHEVKELASGTARATEQIALRVKEIQDDSRQAIDSASQIANVVMSVNGFQGAIAGAVEEQTSTTAEMAQYTGQTAKSVQQIAENITAVSAAAHETTSCVSDAMRATDELTEVSQQLHDVVNRFIA